MHLVILQMLHSYSMGPDPRFFVWSFLQLDMCHRTTKPTKWPVRPAETQISLGIRPVWSESSLCAQWVVKGPMFLFAVSEASDQNGPMPRLIWVFAGCTGHLIGFVMQRLIYCVCKQWRLWWCLPEPSLFANVLRILFSWASSYDFYYQYQFLSKNTDEGLVLGLI